MMAKSHLIVGATSWAVYHHYAHAATYMPLWQTGLLMAVCAMAALLPDIDHPKSTVGQYIYPVSKLISMVFGHRGFTHSLLAVFGMIYLLVAIDGSQAFNLWVTVIAIGYLSHLVADIVTPAGLPLLYPIKYRFTTPFTVEAGGVGETILVVLYALFALALYTNWHGVLLQILLD